MTGGVLGMSLLVWVVSRSRLGRRQRRSGGKRRGRV